MGCRLRRKPRRALLLCVGDFEGDQEPAAEAPGPALCPVFAGDRVLVAVLERLHDGGHDADVVVVALLAGVGVLGGGAVDADRLVALLPGDARRADVPVEDEVDGRAATLALFARNWENPVICEIGSSGGFASM